MIYIVYITTCIPTDQIYIGVHQQNEPYEFDGYLGSGRWMKKGRAPNKQSLNDAIKQYGVDQFKRETLFYYWTRKEAYDKESEIVTKEFIKHSWNFNLIPGGFIPPVNDTTGYKHTTESLIKMKGPRPYMRGEKNPNYGKPMSNEQKRKIRETKIKKGQKPPLRTGNKYNAGKIWINNGKKLKMVYSDKIPYGWVIGNLNLADKNPAHGKPASNRGILHNESTKLKMSLDAKRRMFITNGVEDKRPLKDEPIPDGWWKGRSKAKSSSLGHRNLYIGKRT